MSGFFERFRKKKTEHSDDGRKAKESKEALAASSKSNSKLFISFLVFQLYLLIAFLGVSHKSLLIPGQGVSLPLFGVTLPLFGFFILAPLAVLAFHFHILFSLLQHTRKFWRWRTHASDEDVDFLPAFLFNYVYLRRPGTFTATLLPFFILSAYYFAPLLLLCSMQYKFSAYHSFLMTCFHSVVFLLDLGLLSVYWHRIKDRPFRRNKYGSVFWWRQYHRAYGFGHSLRRLFRFSGKRRRFGRFWTDILALLAAVFSLGNVVALLVYFAEVRGFVKHESLRGEWSDAPSFLTGLSALRGVSVEEGTLSYDLARLVFPALKLHDTSLMLSVPDDGLVGKYRLAQKKGRYDRKWDAYLEYGRGPDLQGRDLGYADFSEAVLVNADFRGARLHHSNFQGAFVLGSKFSRRSGRGPNTANLTGADFTGANLAHANFLDTNLVSTVLRGADLSGAVLARTLMSFADLSGMKLPGANLQDSDLTSADLSGADFTGARLHRSDLSDAVLIDTRLTAANMRETNLVLANLRRAKLSGVNLTSANLAGADLREAKLIGAQLARADFMAADLSSAFLMGANLRGARLPAANLSGADLTGALLDRADFSDAIFSGAKLCALDMSGLAGRGPYGKGVESRNFACPDDWDGYVDGLLAGLPERVPWFTKSFRGRIDGFLRTPDIRTFSFAMPPYGEADFLGARKKLLCEGATIRFRGEDLFLFSDIVAQGILRQELPPEALPEEVRDSRHSLTDYLRLYMRESCPNTLERMR